MKKLILVLTLLFIFTLTACAPEEHIYEYTEFSDMAIDSHSEAESKSNNKYIVYYYQEACSHCQDVKQDILGFAKSFEALDFYLLDAARAPDDSSLEEFLGTPTVFIFSGTEIIESYIGGPRVKEFIKKYEEIELDYSNFDAQDLITYQEILDIDSDTYLVYYYLESCPNCIEIKDQFLSWAFTKNVNQVFFMNGANVIDPDNLPTELQILGSGTPLLIVMSNGAFTDEYYSGKDDILSYIELNGIGDITQD